MNMLLTMPLILGIVGAEAVAQTCLKSSVTLHGFNKYCCIGAGLLGYFVICMLLLMSYMYMPFYMVNSIWSVISIISVMLIGVCYFGENLPLHDCVGIGLMLAGIYVVCMY